MRMRTQVLASGLRVTLSETELRALLNSARFGAEQLSLQGMALERRQSAVIDDVIAGLELAGAGLSIKKQQKTSEKMVATALEQRREGREHHCEVEGWLVTASLGDWCDISDNPDYTVWVDMFNPQTAVRAQGEIRRDVWLVRMIKGSVATGDYSVLPSICTLTANREEIAGTARAAIAKAEGKL